METLKERMDRIASGRAIIHWMIPHPQGPFGVGPRAKLAVPGTYAVACNPALHSFPKLEQASGETHVVNCAECKKHPDFAAKYEPGPKVKRYEDIPEDVRAMIEAHEAKGGA